ncbi:MAG TPA: Hsp20/alpha crystallin family protein [Clostridiales bacterium]|nr:Hsp20/alpha crystallin family protein [Clostridiales bacterium]
MFDLVPFRSDHRSIWNYFDEMERNFFQNFFPTTGILRTDILDEGDHYLLSAELPGFSKEDIRVDLADGMLTIRAQRAEENEESRGNYLRRERRVGSYVRSFDVSDVKTDEITAQYRDGVLTLKLPKLDTQPIPPARQIEIQ